MTRDAAIISTWGATVRGRETKAVEVFGDLNMFWAKKAADGKCSEPESFFSVDGSHGVFMVKGKLDALQEIWDSEENEILTDKGQLIVEDLKSQFYVTGEGISVSLSRYVQAISELGLA
jgi:hypothetical protein